MRFYEVYSSDEYRKIAQSCAEAFSLEFTLAGGHRRSLGSEWKGFAR